MKQDVIHGAPYPCMVPSGGHSWRYQGQSRRFQSSFTQRIHATFCTMASHACSSHRLSTSVVSSTSILIITPVCRRAPSQSLDHLHHLTLHRLEANPQ